MPVYERRTEVGVSAASLYAWHAREGALGRLLPPWERAELESSTGDLSNRRLVMRMRLAGPIWKRWVARHDGHEPGRWFRDVQDAGPFARWEHTHRFEDTPGGSVLVDRVEYEVPLGALGRAVAGRAVAAQIDRMFRFRHRRTVEDLTHHLGGPPMRIAISGASGLIGKQLTAFLTTQGNTVLPLVRRDAKAGEIRWDPAKGTVDVAALEGVDAVVHLAGESVAGGRWTAERKREILESRRAGTGTLARALAGLQRKPAVFVSASAVGFYGDTGDREVDESSPSGAGFLAEVCRAWEEAAEPARAAGIRVVHPRIGVVLSGAGGALAELRTPFSLGVGGPVGSGQQWFPWISMDDTIGALNHLLRVPAEGPVNLVAAAAVRQRELARTLGSVLGRPAVLPLPAFAVRAMFGEMGTEVLLAGQRVAPRRLGELGYAFLRPDLAETLKQELGR